MGVLVVIGSTSMAGSSALSPTGKRNLEHRDNEQMAEVETLPESEQYWVEVELAEWVEHYHAAATTGPDTVQL